MKAGNFELPRYLDRIAYRDEARPDLASVTGIMRQHLRTVPFENLDVQAGKSVSLVPEDIVEKIVHRRRGGYCYEVNGLLAMALAALGVEYRFVGCRPMTYSARRPRTHMAILARLDDEEWLCDVGFGSYGLRAPIRLNGTGAVEQDDDVFELLSQDGREYVLRAQVEGDWANQYCFDLAHHEWVDFMPANWLNSTHPETLFTQHRIVMRQTPEGRVILFDNRLKTIAHGTTTTRHVTEDELPALLAETFGLEPTA
ncbi:arylamine N-acetyltransferase family protein [Thiobacillus sp.]|uniref:arylamine N-acetyltransferase family protein n=1 Tax=Thiobacillus sp. TaxID=924 RepID=UPI00286D8DFE|nr:arylamine N-acetyltransferase [Thiobacillus sp.]